MDHNACQKYASGKREHPLSLYLDIAMALCSAFALVLDLNVRSGNNYINWAESLPDTPVVTAIFAVMLYALRRARKLLPPCGAGTGALSLFLGAWWVLAKSVANTQDLNQPFLSSGQLLKTVVITLGMAAVYGLFFRVLAFALAGKCDWRAERLRKTRIAELYRRHTVLCCAAAVMVMWLPRLFMGYPGVFSSDSLSQIRQWYALEPFTAHHPPFGTLLIGAALDLGNMLGKYEAGLYLYIIVQSLTAAFVIGYSHWIMRRICAPVWLRVLALAIPGLCVVYGANVTAVIKDVPYAYGILLLLCELARVFLLEKERICAGTWIRIALACLVVLLMRNNGKYVVGAVLLVLIVHALRRKGRYVTMACAVLASMMLSMGIESMIMRHWEIEPGSRREALSLPFQQTARFVRDHGDEIPQEEREAIDAVLLYDRIGDFYNPVLADPVKATYKEDASVQDMLRYLRVWFKQFLRDPACYVKATLIQNALLFDPQTDNVVVFKQTGLSDDMAQMLGIYKPPMLAGMQDAAENLRRILFSMPFVMQFNSLGFYCIVLVGVCAIMGKRHWMDMSIYFVPVLISMLIIVLGPCIEHQDRYGFPIIYCMPLLLACASHAMGKKDKGDCEVKA